MLWQEYEGVYVYDTTQLEVKSENNQLLLIGSGGSTMAVLAYKEPLKFQVYITHVVEFHMYNNILLLLV